MNEKKIYSIGGTLWYQEQLTYEEVGLAGTTLSEFSKMFDGQKLTFSDIAGKVYQAGLVPKLFLLILKPHHPDLWAFVKHWVFRVLHRISSKNLARTMKLEEIFGVLADFFFINTQWMESLMISNDPSDTKRKAATLLQPVMSLFSPLMMSQSSSPEVTSPKSSPPSATSEEPKP